MKLNEARSIASTIVNMTNAYHIVTRATVAGSVRREKQEVGDIEILLYPEMEAPCNLFGEESNPVPSQNFVNTMATKIIPQLGGKVVLGSLTGRYCQVDLLVGVKVDFFIIHHDYDWFRQLAIRTGNEYYAHKVIATAWTKRGYVGTQIGLCKKTDCTFSKQGEKGAWTPKPGAEPAGGWKSEEEFFEFIQVPYTRPKMRDAYQ